jgi:TonB family protein
MVSHSLSAQAPTASAGGAPATAPLLVDGEPIVKSWVPPKYPAELEAAGVQGRVTVHLIVDQAGKASAIKVGKSSDPRFDAAALESVAQWVFEPGIEGSQPVAMGVSVRLDFKLPQPKPGLVPPLSSLPKQLPKTDAVVDSAPDPDYPADLLARQISGEAVVDYVVEADGRVTGLQVRAVNQPGFVRPALEATRKLTFKTSMQGDLPVRAKMRSPMEFFANTTKLGTSALTQLEVNGFTFRLAEGERAEDLCDRQPEIWSIPEPVFPRAAALAGQAGEAVVSFELTERGFAKNIEVVSASSPEFGERLVDTLEAGTFKPAIKSGNPVAVLMQWKHVFALPAAQPAEGESSEARLIRLLRSGETIPSPKGLDAPLTPLWRVAPDSSAMVSAEGVPLSADVEAIIDREGRVRLPFVVKASSEKFGRAAVVAASSWVFDPPMRGGQPVDVRVRLPFR